MIRKILNDLKESNKQTFSKEYYSMPGPSQALVIQENERTSIWSNLGEVSVPSYVQTQLSMDSLRKCKAYIKKVYQLEFKEIETWSPNQKDIELLDPKEDSLHPIFMPFRAEHYKHKYLENNKTLASSILKSKNNLRLEQY